MKSPQWQPTTDRLLIFKKKGGVLLSYKNGYGQEDWNGIVLQNCVSEVILFNKLCILNGMYFITKWLHQ